MLINIRALCDFRGEYFPKVLSKLGLGKQVIVISDDEVSQFSLNPNKQKLLSIFLVMIMCWSVFVTGAYLVTKEQAKRKNIRYSRTTHVIESLSEDVATFRTMTDNISSEKKELLEKLALLENTISKEEKHKKELILAINKTTNGQITEIEKIINNTGVKTGHVIKNKPKIKKQASKSGENFSGKGGPYLPDYSSKSILKDDDKKLLKKISYLNDLKDAYENIPLLKPMKKYHITSDFGIRKDPFNGSKTKHHGLDMAWKKNTKIRATAPGKVLYAKKLGAYGYTVIINHKYGFQTRYAHMQKDLKVKKNELVKKGQIIGIQGSTGRSTGDHLHYEVRFNKEAIDPKKFFGKKNGIF